MIDAIAIAILVFLAFSAFIFRRSLTYLHIYQQEEYDTIRFLKWITANRAFDKRLSAFIIAVSVLSLFVPPFVSAFLIFTAFAGAAYIEKDPRHDSKKKLVLTQRARRILFAAFALDLLAAGAWIAVPFVTPYVPWVCWLVNIHLAPFMILAVNEALQPYEKSVQERFRREAHDKIMDYRPKIIAITGSFGKTSVKHILGHILKMHAPTLITPGSVNTLMGISRIIREDLAPEHKYFIVEMGAYGPGSIRELCKLTPPDMGIITAIGHAHYERFKSLDTVAQAKYELAQSVLRKEDGIMIVHEDTLRFDHARAIRSQHPEQFVTCGEDKDAGLVIRDVTQTETGLEIGLSWKGQDYALDAPLFGLHHGHNVALAFAAALELGLEAQDVIAALKTVPQIQHRLEVKAQPGGMLVIDDAYNANPAGFRSALELLDLLGKTARRKILITPGMVELGRAHAEAHEKIGRYAGQVCDVALVVNGARIPSFIEGYRATAGADKPLHNVAGFAQAQGWVAQNGQAGDVILIENDLMDLYETVPKM